MPHLPRKIKQIIGKIYFYMQNTYWQEQYKIYREKYQIHPTFRFNGQGILFYGDGQICVGEKGYIGNYSYLQASKGTLITIGKSCAISHNVKIYTTSYNSDQDFNSYPRLKKSGDVSIGDAVWIGVNVFINPGVTIGNNAIIGANSVVAKDVAPFSIVGGVPA